ncbi:MAG TPA: Uma2 family endonuclease [Coleofasciculaceae cyanobacterium]|jgi:Uma2 family endonuclease
MTVPTAKWSVEDYHHMIETGLLDDRPVELLNGEIIEMPSEGTSHANGSTNAAEYLRDLLGKQVQVREGHPITISSGNSEPEPDIAIVQRLARGYEQHHPYPENIFWLIEYADSSLKKDLDPKAKAYAAAGIAEYWVVNLQAMELVVMRDPVEGEYRSQVIWREDTIRPLAFADVSVSVSRMLS